MSEGKKVQLTKIEENVLRALYEAHKKGEDSPLVEVIAKAAKCTEAEALRALNRLHVLGMVGKPDLAEVALSTVDKALREIDENADCNTASRVLMASIMIGSGDEEKICRMGLPADDVRVIGDRLRRNGVWDAGGVDEPRDGVEFCLLCAVADGLMERQFNRDKGEWMYQNTPDGMERAKRMLKQ